MARKKKAFGATCGLRRSVGQDRVVAAVRDPRSDGAKRERRAGGCEQDSGVQTAPALGLRVRARVYATLRGFLYPDKLLQLYFLGGGRAFV